MPLRARAGRKRRTSTARRPGVRDGCLRPPELVLGRLVAGEEPDLDNLAVGDPEQVDTVHGHLDLVATGAEADRGGHQIAVEHRGAISSSSKVPALAAIIPPIIAFTASAPSWVPENWLAPGWCHTMSGARKLPTLAKSLAISASKYSCTSATGSVICPPELGLNLLEANPY